MLVRDFWTAFVIWASAQLVQIAALSGVSTTAALSPRKPNFVYIITDDQDYATANEHVMPHLAEWFASQGTNYTNFYTPMSVCCPSRVGFLRGQHGHSHNVTNVVLPCEPILTPPILLCRNTKRERNKALT